MLSLFLASVRSFSSGYTNIVNEDKETTETIMENKQSDERLIERTERAKDRKKKRKCEGEKNMMIKTASMFGFVPSSRISLAPNEHKIHFNDVCFVVQCICAAPICLCKAFSIVGTHTHTHALWFLISQEMRTKNNIRFISFGYIDVDWSSSMHLNGLSLLRSDWNCKKWTCCWKRWRINAETNILFFFFSIKKQTKFKWI